MVWVSPLLAMALAIAPTFVSAGIFPKGSLVKMIDSKGYREAMKENRTTIVAFIAPWCGHCQRMAPEYSKAALGLYPLVPIYAVNCDKDSNKRLCSEQGVQGFPTIKLYPRGSRGQPLLFDGPDRTASAFYYWAIRNIPHGIKKIYRIENIPEWIEANTDKPRALLLNQGKDIPLLWSVLSNKYKDHIKFTIHRDRHGKSSVAWGLEKGEKGSSKVLLYPTGETDYVRYEGILKYDSLSKFFDSVIDGTADLRLVNEEAKKEEFVPDEAELEIERKQEAQRLALAHGGFSDIIDFEEAVKQGHGADFHGKHGFPGMMGSLPKKGEAQEEQQTDEKVEDPIHKILKAQREAAEKSANAPKMMKTGGGSDGERETIWVPPPDTKQPRTPAPSGTLAGEPVVAEVTISAVSSVDEEKTTSTATTASVTATETGHTRDEL
ncbi:hypothetical protein BDY19DRAFT_931045 [Irpex rosettiformis]|uniref:Uncharacterized protein n=1 Tax=Irpex rosettiformis TaxID=378272 RepID=A0ACB8UBE2_9APHY|nr:hypothetical protein BDY19DRAFT_931045 [Irpex rosettiformis]